MVSIIQYTHGAQYLQERWKENLFFRLRVTLELIPPPHHYVRISNLFSFVMIWVIKLVSSSRRDELWASSSPIIQALSWSVTGSTQPKHDRLSTGGPWWKKTT